MKGCRRTRSRIEKAIDGRLSLEERFLLDEHLAACPRCAERFERAMLVEEALQRGPEPALESLDVEGAVSSIRRAVFAAPAKEVPEAAYRRRVALAAAAVAAVAISAAIWSYWTGTGRGEPDDRPGTETAAYSAPEDDVPGEAVSDELDPRRLQIVRSQVSDHLRAAFAGFAEIDDPSPSADDFDELTRELRRTGWPVVRIVEGLLLDGEPEVARSAARYLGVRGDRASVGRLATALGETESARAIVWALGDLGEPGIPALATALRDPGVEGVVVAQLGRIGGRRAAEVIEEEMHRASDDPPRRELLLAGLRRIGPPALESFLRLARENPDDSTSLLEHLARIDGAEGEFTRIVESSGRRYSTDLLLDAAARLQPTSALEWIEELCRDYRHREEALACLEQWGGDAPLATVLKMDGMGTVFGDELLATLDELIDRDPSRLAGFVESRIASRERFEVERLLDLLLATENPWTSESLVMLALTDLLPLEARQWAALAVGELGDEADAERLLSGLPGIEPSERRLVAACLITIHEHLGRRGVEKALKELSVRSSERVLSALTEVSPSGTSAVGLHRVARALDGASTAKYPKPRRSSS